MRPEGALGWDLAAEPVSPSAAPPPPRNDQMEVQRALHIFEIRPFSQLPAALWINVAGRRCSQVCQESKRKHHEPVGTGRDN